MRIPTCISEVEYLVLYERIYGYYPFPDRERLRIARLVDELYAEEYKSEPIYCGYYDFIDVQSFDIGDGDISPLSELVLKDTSVLNSNIILMDKLLETHKFKESPKGIFPEMNDSELIDYLSKLYHKEYSCDLPEETKKRAHRYLEHMILRSRVLPLLLIPNHDLNLDNRCHNHVKEKYKSLKKRL